MDPDSLLRSTFGDGTLMRGDEAFYDVSTALAVVEYCRHHELAVAGMDGVLVDDSDITPLLDCIADFSRNPGATWAETVLSWDDGARRVLEAWGAEHPELRVSMTVISQEEWLLDAR